MNEDMQAFQGQRRRRRAEPEQIAPVPIEEIMTLDEQISQCQKALEAAKAQLAPLEEELELRASKVEAAEFYAHHPEGGIIPGKKVYEHDLKKTTDPDRQRMLKLGIKLSEEKAKIARAEYQRLFETIATKWRSLNKQILDLNTTLEIIISQKEDLLKGKGPRKTPTPAGEKRRPESIAPAEAAGIIEALRAHLRESRPEIISEGGQEAFKRSLERYKADHEEELERLTKFIAGAGLNLVEVDLLYMRLTENEGQKN